MKIRVVIMGILFFTIFSCFNKTKDASELDLYLKNLITECDNLFEQKDISKSKIEQFYKKIQNYKYDDKLRWNYFVKNEVTTSEDEEYFGGNYNKMNSEIESIMKQLGIVLEGIDIEKLHTYSINKLNSIFTNKIVDYDKSALTNKKMIEYYSKLYIDEAKGVYNKKVNDSLKDKVKGIITNFIKNNGGVLGLIDERKDALVSKLGFKVTNTESTTNDYGLAYKYTIEGNYSYKNNNFRVKCSLESGGDNNYYYSVSVYD